MIKKAEDIITWGESIYIPAKMKSLSEVIASSNKGFFAEKHSKTVFSALLTDLWFEYDGLKYDYNKSEHSSLSLLAWRTRNLLELNVWCQYCCLKKGNSEIFFQDGCRDALDLSKYMDEWGKKTNQSEAWFENREDSKNKTINEANKHGVSDLDDKYLRVSNVAKKCGLENSFSIHYKFLSKFAHPTAFRLFIEDDKQEVARQADYFLKRGTNYFYDALSRLEKFLEENEKEVTVE